VHFCDYPAADARLIDPALESRMAVTRRVVTLARKLREDHKLKVRQPLRRLSIVHRDAALRDAVLASAALIADEINVKAVDVLADESAFATVTVKPNFKTLGKRCGPKLKEIAAALAGWSFPEVSRLEAGEPITVAGEALSLGDVLLQRSSRGDAAVATDGDVTLVLDTELDDALRREGVARELVSLLQAARKEAGLELTDRIAVSWACADAGVAEAVREHAGAIASEVLAVEFREGEGTTTVDLNKVPVRITLTRREAG
jgi:isoleucyl-tRNA synthetase